MQAGIDGTALEREAGFNIRLQVYTDAGAFRKKYITIFHRRNPGYEIFLAEGMLVHDVGAGVTLGSGNAGVIRKFLDCEVFCGCRDLQAGCGAHRA